jgi:hypothetical protein
MNWRIDSGVRSITWLLSCPTIILRFQPVKITDSYSEDRCAARRCRRRASRSEATEPRVPTLVRGLIAASQFNRITDGTLRPLIAKSPSVGVRRSSQSGISWRSWDKFHIPSSLQKGLVVPLAPTRDAASLVKDPAGATGAIQSHPASSFKVVRCVFNFVCRITLSQMSR